MAASERVPRYLREHEQAFRRLTENAREVFWISDPERFGTIYVNPAFEAIWDRPRERLYDDPRTLIDSVHPEDRARVERAMDEKTETEGFDETYRIRRPDGDIRWIHDRAFPVYDGEGALDNVVGIAADITDRKRREETLSALHETARAMTRTDSPAEIHDLAVAAASDLFSFSRAASYRLDPTEYALRPAARGPAASAFVEENDRIDEGPIHSAFVDGAVVAEEGITAIPLGSHGVLALAAEVDPESLSLVRVLCDNTEAALDRIERESVVQTQSETLRRANAELERLNHVTDLVRDVAGALVRATSREEIETTVCERLAAADHYRFAWIGEGGDEIDPTGRAGITEAALDGLRSGSGYESPAARAVRTGEPAIDRALLDSSRPDRRADALSGNYRSVAAVPLGHRDRIYGVLSVYAGCENAFGECEREVLSELGETIGYAIDATETRNALASDGVTELRISIGDPHTLPRELAAAGRFEHRGVVPRSDGSVRWFVTVDAPLDRVRSVAEGIERVETVRSLATEETTLIECLVRRPCLLAPFVEHGTTVEGFETTADGTIVTVEAAETDVRSLCEALESQYERVELIGKRDLDRPPRTREELRSAVSNELTDRQREILRIAYTGGYFETPRRITGAELADHLDINRSTFHRTLRAAEQAAFEALLD